MSPEAHAAPPDLARAFEEFAAYSSRLQEAFGSLQSEVRVLAAELSAKNQVIEALERQAARNERIAAMGELAQRIAHQIRNPLCSVQLYTSLLDRELRGHDSHPLVARISAAAQSCELVVRNLLAFADDVDPVRVPTSVHGCLREVLDVATQLVAARGVRVVLRADAGEDGVEADPDLLRQAILNLVANAAQAAGEGGEVVVATENRRLAAGGPAWIAVRVVDHGPGIDPADLERIFDPLYSTRRGAAGLGLAIVQRVAQAHAGLIEVESEPGRGSSFRLSLPLHIPAILA